MATSLKLRRGTTTAHSTFTGAEGEVTVDTTKDTIVVHDGSTAGGFPLAKESGSNISAGTLSATSISDSGNLTFTGTGNRIRGDFSNGTVANRVAFQTSTTNGATALGVIPNGTSNYAEFSVNSDSSYTNSSTLAAIVDGSTSSIRAGIRGTGSYLPMTFYTGGSERMRIDTSGNVGVGTSIPTALLNLYTNITGGNTSSMQKWSWQDTSASASWGLKLDQIHTGSAINYSFRIRNGTTTDIESLYLQSTGNVGIGTSSPGSKLDVNGGSIGQYRSTGDNLGLSVLSGSTSFNSYVRMANGTQSVDYGQGNGTAFVNVNNNQPWYVLTGGSERMRIDSSGNVGIGTSSPQATLNVAGQIRIDNNTTDPNNGSAYLFQQSGIGWNMASTNIAFTTGTSGARSERMRIDSSGNVLVGQTSTSGGADGKLSVTTPLASGLPAFTAKSSDGSGQYTGIFYNSATSGNNAFLLFGTEGTFTTRGGITYNRAGGLTAYNTTSDQRLKENIVDATSALSKIDSVKVRSFDWKETGNHVDFGVIAQELIDVAPECVTEGDSNDEIETTWQVDTSALVPALVKAIQELKAELDVVKSELNILKGN